MSIQQVTEKETRLSNMLTACTEALKQVTAERDALLSALAACRDAVPDGVARDWLSGAIANPEDVPGYVKAAFDALKALRDSGVELPDAKHKSTPITIFTKAELIDYGDRRAMAERERAAKVCELAASQCGETLRAPLAPGERLVARGAQVQAEKLAEAIRKGEKS